MSRQAFEATMRRKEDNAFKRCYRQTRVHPQDETHARLTTQRKMVAVLYAMWTGGTSYRDDMDTG